MPQIDPPEKPDPAKTARSPHPLDRHQQTERLEATTAPGGSTPRESTEDDPVGLSTTTEYTDLLFLAKGGLGEVFVGIDKHLHRQVALKFLDDKLADDRESADRFFTEAEVTGGLDHPGIVSVLGFGTNEDGRPFYTMKFVQGETFKQAIDSFHEGRRESRGQVDSSVEFRKLLASFVSICKTIGYAHNRGIVHLDIKPSNVMLGKYGETYVVDWGLAASFQRDERAKASGEETLRLQSELKEQMEIEKGAGSPFYMSPEQIPGSIVPIGPWSDVYGLGATLYYLLTGKPSVSGTTLTEIWQKKLETRIVKPSLVTKGIPRALEAICIKAIATTPEMRYMSVLDMAEDIENWLADEPVGIYQEGWLERISRWMRHHPVGTSLVLAGLLGLVLLSSVTALLFQRSAESERLAREETELAREDGLRVSARFAGRSIAHEIELRWLILEAAAADSQLRALFEAAEKGPLDEANAVAIQSWLDARFHDNLQATKASSWFANNATGVQIGRSPFSDLTVGKNYAFRDYFHGQGRDLDEKIEEKPAPIREPHLNCAFQSQADNAYKVAFSVPVWSGPVGVPDRKVLGILAMSVEVGHFVSVRRGLGDTRRVVLVDTRQDWLDGKASRGLILHHPQLAERYADTSERKTFRIGKGLVTQLLLLRRQRMLWERSTFTGGGRIRVRRKIDGMSLDLAYVDPLAPAGSANMLASYEPVFVPGKANRIQDTGLVVIVQEPK